MDKYKNNNNYAKTFSNGFIIKKFNISKQDNVNKTRNISPLSKTDRQCFSVHNNSRKKLKILTINSDKLILSKKDNKNFPKGNIFHSKTLSHRNYKKNKRKVLSLDLNIKESKPNIRKIDQEIKNLLSKGKRKIISPTTMSTKSITQETINIDKIKEYNECMEIIHKKPSYVVDLVRKKKQIRTDNKYFDSIINKVIRKIIFLNGKNEFISEAIVMNLLNNEISQLKESIDKIAKANCSIKNYSKVIFNKTNIFLPLINTLTEQITKAPTNLVTEENVIKSNRKFDSLITQMKEQQLTAKLKAIKEQKNYFSHENNIDMNINHSESSDDENELQKQLKEQLRPHKVTMSKIYSHFLSNYKHQKNKTTKKKLQSKSLPNIKLCNEMEQLMSIDSTVMTIRKILIKSSTIVNIFTNKNTEGNMQSQYDNKLSLYREMDTSPWHVSQSNMNTISNVNSLSNMKTNITSGKKEKTKLIIKNPSNLKSISTIKKNRKSIIINNQEGNKIQRNSIIKRNSIAMGGNKQINQRKSVILNAKTQEKTKIINKKKAKSVHVKSYQHEKHLNIEVNDDDEEIKINDELNLSSSSSSNKSEQKDQIPPAQEKIVVIHRMKSKKPTKKPETDNEKQNLINQIENEFLTNLSTLSEQNVDVLLQNEDINEQIEKLRNELITIGNEDVKKMNNKELLVLMIKEKKRLSFLNIFKSKSNITSILSQIDSEKKEKEDLINKFNLKKMIKPFSQRKSISFFGGHFRNVATKTINVENDKTVKERCDNFFQSIKGKLNELNLNQEIKYQLTFQQSEESKEKFLELLHRIEELKKMDNDSYLKSLEDNYNTYKEEIEGLVEARQMEERINKFIASSEAHIKMKMNHRQLVQDNLNVKDNIVNFILEDNNINK